MLVVAGCGSGGSSPTTTTAAAATTTTTTTTSGAVTCTTVDQPADGARTEKKPTASLDPSKTYVVTFQTNCGSFSVTLDQKQSPEATASFVSLVDDKYFDDTIFHRIVPGFVIQGGDPTATGEGGPGYSTVDTPPKTAAYTHGVVAMAKTGAQPAGTAGSQFFVVTTANAGLTPDYAIIGTVTSGLAVCDKIGTFGDASDPSGTPTRIVEIEKATVSTS